MTLYEIDYTSQVFGIVEYYYMLICHSRLRPIFLGVLYGYKGVLQVIALFLAFTTRKVKVKGLNDTLYIAAATYITSLLWAVAVVSTYTLRDYINIFASVFSLCLFLGTLAIVSLVFIPKVIVTSKVPSNKGHFLSFIREVVLSLEFKKCISTVHPHLYELLGTLNE